MRSHKLIAGLALTVGVVTPLAVTANPAAARATSCRVQLYDIDSLNAAERDGRDELRFLVGGNLFPRFTEDYFPMVTGGDGDPADFEHPTTVVGTIGSVGFDLREVTPPAAGTGDSLGVAIANGVTCFALDRGEVAIEDTFLDGTDETFYSYHVRLKLTGL
ncbi:hypothetical protein OUY22_18625 [Nonomuraea sp. MCN248]|uniref:Uncharacterized protein n=1 Tax=Nonomuraea corallina TaxID=2989783 RepID=A0ABT4SE10_9ACTN|nr:hypothetical protein [Nonomuraea corallina]MDA0635442.1 hypothetical protein [Nonomuraea corallina]